MTINQKIGIRVVASDHRAKVLATLRYAKPLTNSHFVAKSLALLLAVQFCKEIGIN